MIQLDAAEQVYPNRLDAHGLRALQPIDLHIREGEFVSLLGPSGCGKSTLLRMMAGLLAPTAGQVRVQGQPPDSVAARRELSFVFQEPTLMPWASVATNVRLPLDLAGVPRPEADARVSEALTQVGLEGFGAQRPRELSGGMQMRVSIARGLVTRPRLLLMDEPFGALDELTRHRLDADLLALWRTQGLTVVFVTHSLSEAAFLSSRIVVMAPRPGRIVDDLALDTPWPREAHHRTSPAFNAVVRRLEDALAASHEAP